LKTDETDPKDWFLLVGADYDLLRAEAAKLISLILSVSGPPVSSSPGS
jgi:hypothetical protein